MRSATKRTTGKLPKKDTRDGLSERGNRPGIMPLEANAASPEGGTWSALGRRVSPLYRHEQRGKNGSFRLPGTHKPRYREWHDDENRASLCLHSAPAQVLVSTLHSPAR